MGKKVIPRLSFSLKRVLGITALKRKTSRETGIPLTKGGLERKIGGFIIKKYLIRNSN